MKTFSYKITETDGKISEVSLNRRENRQREETNLEKDFKCQLNEYLSGKRKTFSVPVLVEGTDFQKKVWKEMSKIPYGKTISYGALAKKIKMPKAYRAVANACGANKIPIILPCHRVVAKDGLGGYSAGIEIKKRLLKIENMQLN